MLPPELLALDPVPTTRFFHSGPQGRTDGGLFALDGVHPTTIGYGIIAQEVIRIMDDAGVTFTGPGAGGRPGRHRSRSTSPAWSPPTPSSRTRRRR